MDVNKATELVTGVSREQLIGTDFSNYFTEPEKAQRGIPASLFERICQGLSSCHSPRFRESDGCAISRHGLQERGWRDPGCLCCCPGHHRAEGIAAAYRSHQALLNLFVRMPSRKEYLDASLELIQNWSSCRCAGIRVLNEKDYIPYESYRGFSQSILGIGEFAVG